MKLILAGASGLVGRHVLALALEDPRVEAVVAPTRRALPGRHRKLLAPTVDFDRLPEDADWWRADAVVCALGTTIRTAGSRAAFRQVDFGYPLAVARLAHRHGTPAYALNSAKGADPDSRIFYSRTKGELEQALAKAESCGAGAYIEVVMDRMAASPLAEKLGESIKTLYASAT